MLYQDKVIDPQLVEQVLQDDELYQYLRTFVTPNKKALFEEVLSHRTRHLTVLLEDLYLPQNASAVLRSADCFGVQDVHIVEINHKYKINPKVVRGASKWIDRHHYTDTSTAIQSLKDKGYKVAATTPHTDMELDDLPLDNKVALMFGQERNGLTDTALEEADYRIKIPMYGFTESFNISVSAAICFNHIITKLRHRPDIDWKMSEEERKELETIWVLKNIKRSDVYLREYIKRGQNK
ncbi:RNA methyltransferase [Algivirga pacifica]|uniref:tRNA (guanosine(18)-2'-O)-methyltransferase n=1 Tax=Algivirga pacifica TaxID=1162670 RepID=A0ABP9DBV6_9BACT